jgi:hypothetical protein
MAATLVGARLGGCRRLLREGSMSRETQGPDDRAQIASQTRSADAERAVRRLERRLADVRDLEVKRRHRLDRARRRGVPRSTQARRRRKLDRVLERSVALAARIEQLRAQAMAPAPAEAETDDPVVRPLGAGPRAYCLRERRAIVMADVRETVMRDGRRGLAGTCPACGARVARSA